MDCNVIGVPSIKGKDQKPIIVPRIRVQALVTANSEAGNHTFLLKMCRNELGMTFPG